MKSKIATGSVSLGEKELINTNTLAKRSSSSGSGVVLTGRMDEPIWFMGTKTPQSA